VVKRDVERECHDEFKKISAVDKIGNDVSYDVKPPCPKRGRSVVADLPLRPYAKH